MQATAGDIIRLRGTVKGQRARTGCVIDARGPGGGPPYLVRFTDGRVSLVYDTAGGFVERPASRISTAVARASSVQPRPRPPAHRPRPGIPVYPVSGLLVVMAIPAFVALLIVRGVNANVPGAESLLIALATIAASVPVILLSRLIERRIYSWLRLPVRLLLVGTVLAAQTLAMLWLGSVFDSHQRCIDPTTMTVIPSAACQGQTGQPGSTGPQLYSGGTGLQVGDPVKGGSLAPPPGDGNDDGGVSGDVGGDGGDSGGDSGGDGGGGEGGGDG